MGFATTSRVSSAEDERAVAGKEQESEHHTLPSIDEFEDSDDAQATGKGSSLPEDILSVEIRKGTMGVGLVAVLTMNVVMASISVLGIISYNYEPSTSSAEVADPSPCTSGKDLPLWADLLVSQIDVIQNLIHASLVGAGAMVAAFRGDALWLFFARNCGLYLGVTAYSYLAVSIAGMRQTGWTGNFQQLSRCVLEAIMAVAGTIAFFRLEWVRQRVIGLQHKHFDTRSVTESHHSSSADRPQYPPFLAETKAQRQKSEFLFKMARGIQFMFVGYSVRTTWAYITFNSCDSDDDTVFDTRLLDGDFLWTFEGSYTSGGHQAMLLSLVFLAATFPRYNTSVGGALLVSSWRLLIALAYLPRVIPLAVDSKTLWPLIYSCIEIVIMGGIVVTAALQFRENSNARPNGQQSKAVGGGKQGAYNQVPAGDDEDDEEQLPSEVPNETSIGPMCWTMRQISRSSNYSTKQRQGAWLMWIGSLLLLCGMTIECFLLLSQGVLGTVFTNDVYKWGMHVCAMYLFCAIMVASCPEVYERARILMAFACPAGSIIGMWQLWYLWTNLDNWNVLSVTAGCFFAFRAACGLCQTLGLIRLHDIKEITPSEGAVQADNLPELETLVARGKSVLFHIYFPALALYLILTSLMGTCNHPLVSPTVQDECVGQGEFVLEPSWPGFGVLFHYGFLLVVFSSEGLATKPSYRPNLLIGLLFAMHFAILIAFSLVVEGRRIVMSRAFPMDHLMDMGVVTFMMVGSTCLSNIMLKVSKRQV